MSFSDCEKCWETPCVCGHQYRSWDPERIKKQIAMLQKVLAERGGFTKCDKCMTPNLCEPEGHCDRSYNGYR